MTATPVEDDIRGARMITNNLSRTVVELFASQCRVPLDRVFRDRAIGDGHVFAADGLINLAAAGAALDDVLLIATNGTCNRGAAVVRALGTVI
jgi:hypothetical protein